MRKSIIYLFAGLLTMVSCIDLETEPLVTLNPSVGFKAHIRGDSVYVSATVSANPDFIDPGNIPTLFKYEGELDLYNERSGNLLGTTIISGSGLSSVHEVVAVSEDFEEIIIIAKGQVIASADKESDGDTSNDVMLHTASFNEVTPLTDVVNIEDYPIVVLDPLVEFQSYISNGSLFTTATISANPDYIVTGILPITFYYDGVMQLYDEVSGILLKSSSLSGTGLSNAVSISADTAGFAGFVIVASGNITATANVGNDADTTNDLYISEAEFSEILEVNLQD